MPDETVRLSCEIQYGTKVDRKIPNMFWFDDIYNVNLLSTITKFFSNLFFSFYSLIL
jgi:hypothetical protein